MASPPLSTGMLLSPSYGVPPSTGIETIPTTMESNEQAPTTAAGSSTQIPQPSPHLDVPTAGGASSSSPLNGNNGSLAAGSTSTPAPAATAATTVAGSAKKKKEYVLSVLRRY